MREVTSEALLPLTMTWLPLRMWVARYWKETLSIQWNTCCRLPNAVTPSSVTHTHTHTGGAEDNLSLVERNGNT